MWYVILCCTEGLLKAVTVPLKKGFSRNYGVKCALLKIPIIFFLSLFSISYFIYTLNMDVILALEKLLNI